MSRTRKTFSRKEKRRGQGGVAPQQSAPTPHNRRKEKNSIKKKRQVKDKNCREAPGKKNRSNKRRVYRLGPGPNVM